MLLLVGFRADEYTVCPKNENIAFRNSVVTFWGYSGMDESQKWMNELANLLWQTKQ